MKRLSYKIYHVYDDRDDEVVAACLLEEDALVLLNYLQTTYEWNSYKLIEELDE
jgi:hypothetical protein